jgi:hypothetical protein
MLGKITASATAKRQPVDSQVEVSLSSEYLINTDHIIDVVDKTSYRNLRYKFNIYDDRQTDLYMAVGTSLAAIQTLADVSQDSEMISLDVFEGIESFNQISGLTAVETTFNVNSIVWGDTDEGDTITRVWYVIGGKQAVPIIVDHTIEEIVTLATA